MRELEALFEKHDFNSFPVVEKEKMLGIVTKFDFLRAFAFTTGQMVPHYDDLMRRPVAEMMTEAVVSLRAAKNVPFGFRCGCHNHARETVALAWFWTR